MNKNSCPLLEQWEVQSVEECESFEEGIIT